MSNNIRDAVGMLLAMIVFCCLKLFLKLDTTFSLFVAIVIALIAGLILVGVYKKRSEK